MTSETKETEIHRDAAGLRPAMLGRKFRLENDAETYVVCGLKGRSDSIALQAESTDEVRNFPMAEFLKMATQIDD